MNSQYNMHCLHLFWSKEVKL